MDLYAFEAEATTSTHENNEINCRKSTKRGKSPLLIISSVIVSVNMTWITVVAVRHTQFQEMVKIFNGTDEDSDGKEVAEQERKARNGDGEQNKEQLHSTLTSRWYAISRTFSPKP